MRSAGHRLVPFVLALAACTSSPGLLPLPAAPLPLYDALSGPVSAERWAQGESRMAPEGGAAVLSEAIASLPAREHYVARLFAIAPGGGRVTSFGADVTVTAAGVTGDSIGKVGLDLVFQPLARRLQRPYTFADALVARVSLQKIGDTLYASHSVVECPSDTPNCGAPVAVGSASGSGWAMAVPASAGVPYALRVDVDPATERFFFSLAGGGLALADVIDVSGVTSATAPFDPDLSASAFRGASLIVAVSGGAAGGGDGAVTAAFDDVVLGEEGAAPAAFDDFSSGVRFDPSRWAVGAARVRSGGAGLEVSLDQADAPAAVPLELVRASATALQADVTVTAQGSSGPGRIAAELRSSLYNDGTNGSGTAPDVNAPHGQVGDVLAIVSATGTDVSHAVIRCDSATCSRFTFVQPYTSLGAVSPGTRHTLSARWDAARHAVTFGLDGRSASFDPVQAGYPVAGAAQSPCKRIGVQAGPASPSEAFEPGSAGSITAIFRDVRTD